MRNRVNLICALCWITILHEDLYSSLTPYYFKVLAFTLAFFYIWAAFKGASILDLGDKNKEESNGDKN